MYGDVDVYINGNKTLQKHRDLLKTLCSDRVMCVGYEDDDTFFMQECCDEWYYHNLTREECIELSELFKELAQEISVMTKLKNELGLM